MCLLIFVLTAEVTASEILVHLPFDWDAIIERALEAEPSAEYEPRHEPSISPEPIVTVKMQPIDPFDSIKRLSELNICLVGFGLCE